MKKRLLYFCAAFLLGAITVFAQRTYTFKAGTLNVDGLPNEIGTIEINPDGLGDAGATKVNNYIANSGWDIVGFSEDFNYHASLVAAPASNYYGFGAHGGSVGASAIFGGADTDGLGIAVAKWLTFPGEGSKGTVYSWDGYNGFTDQGADGLVTKGFRMYTITFSTGIAVDYYILHMDADSGTEDINMRNTQLTELATQVIAKTKANKRPAIITGDTNCRYTRERLKELLIDVVNAEAELTIKDAWVEIVRNGVYPTYNTASLSEEVVDKVFYINTTDTDITLKANSYLRDDKAYLSDHDPVMVNFTIEDPDGEPVVNEVPGPDSEVVLTDGTPADPTSSIAGTYYLKNANSGLFLKSAGPYGSHASEGVHAMPMTFNFVSNTSYYITHTIPNCFLGDNCYLDNGAQANWRIKEITRSDGVKKYVLLHPTSDTALSSFGDGNVDVAAYNATDTKQHWLLYTADMIKEEMPATISGGTYNASTLIPYGRVDTHHADTRKAEWQGAPGFSGWSANANHSMEKHFWAGETQTFDVYQEITGLPAGTYTLTAQAFHRSGDHGSAVKTVLPDLYATNGSSTTKTIKVCSINDASAPATKPNSMHEAGDAFLAGAYNVTLSDITVGNDGNLRIGVRNTSSDNSARLWCCFNNFQLIYHGTSLGDLKGTQAYKDVKAAIDAANEVVASLPDEAKKAYDISDVIWRYNNNLISIDGSVEIAMIEEALSVAVKSQTSKGSDMTYAIVNNSFEMGDLTGWTTSVIGSEIGVKPNSNATYTVSNADGGYIFNTWTGSNNCPVLTQSIRELKNGYYKLQALVTSANNSVHVYLVGNNQYAGTNAFSDGTAFVNAELDFLVENGVANIGTVASKNGKFYYREGDFFKSDNYRLSYEGTLGQGRVKIALADAKQKAESLTADAKAEFLAAVASYDWEAIEGDGKAEEASIYAALRDATKTQRLANTEMTWAIENPTFATGEWSGWNVVNRGDTKVGHQESSIYALDADGLYLFNTWNNNPDWTDPGINAPITQTINGLPNGRYRLTAMLASDKGNTLCVVGNETAGSVVAVNVDTMSIATVEFEVTDGTATIGAVGARDGVYNAEGGAWYKVDDFRLTYLGRELVLNETDNSIGYEDGFYTSVTLNRNVKAGVWNTFVVPFDMTIPSGWSVKSLTNAVQNGDVISMSYETVNGTINAGTPYMVMAEEAWTGITLENIDVTSSLNDINGNGLITFKGNYISGTVPVGSFFISDNIFYQAEDETNTIKAFRGYLEPTNPAGVKSLGYSFDDVDFTGIEGVEGNATEIIAIYGVDGTLRSDLQKGINIVKMSNGTTKKVMVK